MIWPLLLLAQEQGSPAQFMAAVSGRQTEYQGCMDSSATLYAKSTDEDMQSVMEAARGKCNDAENDYRRALLSIVDNGAPVFSTAQVDEFVVQLRTKCGERAMAVAIEARMHSRRR